MKWLASCVACAMFAGVLTACGGGVLGGKSPTATFGPAVQTRLAEANAPIATRTPRPTSTPRVKQQPTVVGSQSSPKADGPTATLIPTPTPNPLVGQFSEVLLSINDLPSGWALWSATDEIDVAPTDDICGYMVQNNSVVETQVEYQRSFLGPFFGQAILLYPTADEASYTLNDLQNGFNACPAAGFTYEDEDLFMRVSPLAFSTVGDESFAYRITLIIGDFGVEQDVVLSRVGSVLNIVGYGSVSGSVSGFDSSETENFVQLAIDKIRSMEEYINSLEVPAATI